MLRLSILFCFHLWAGLVFVRSAFCHEKEVLPLYDKLICTAAELACIGHDPDFPLHGSYSLAHAIDLRDIAFLGIGTEKEPFTGIFYGNGHVISGFSVESNQNYIGLFRMIGQGAVVQDVILKASVIQGKAYVGLLAGYNQGMIKNCFVQGEIMGTYDVGGLVGINGNYGKIWLSEVIGTVHGSRYEIGGLAGCNLGTITESRTCTAIVGIAVVGGLVGMNDEQGYIAHCLAKGTVSGERFVGGLVGHNWFHGIIDHCLSQTAVKGEEYVGGLVGANYVQAQIKKSSSSSTVEGLIHVGMVVGANRGTILYQLDLQDHWRYMTNLLINKYKK